MGCCLTILWLTLSSRLWTWQLRNYKCERDGQWQSPSWPRQRRGWGFMTWWTMGCCWRASGGPMCMLDTCMQSHLGRISWRARHESFFLRVVRGGECELQDAHVVHWGPWLSVAPGDGTRRCVANVPGGCQNDWRAKVHASLNFDELCGLQCLGPLLNLVTTF